MEGMGDLFHQPQETVTTLSHKMVSFEDMQLRLVDKHALWGDHLWNASRWLSGQFLNGLEPIKDLSVVELGAGAGLTSLVAGRMGASLSVVTDYPDPELVENLRWNIQHHGLQERVKAVGYRWGDSVDELLALNEGNRFDRVLLCDLVFNHSEHLKLFRSVDQLLAPHGLAYCVFTHYRPWLAERDMDFLRLAEEAGWRVTRIAEYLMPMVMFEADRGDPVVRRTVHSFIMQKQ